MTSPVIDPAFNSDIVIVSVVTPVTVAVDDMLLPFKASIPVTMPVASVTVIVVSPCIPPVEVAETAEEFLNNMIALSLSALDQAGTDT